MPKRGAQRAVWTLENLVCEGKLPLCKFNVSMDKRGAQRAVWSLEKLVCEGKLPWCKFNVSMDTKCKLLIRSCMWQKTKNKNARVLVTRVRTSSNNVEQSCEHHFFKARSRIPPSLFMGLSLCGSWVCSHHSLDGGSSFS